jgi:hypothetical protein
VIDGGALGGVDGAGVAVVDVLTGVAGRQCQAGGSAGHAVGGVEFDRDVSAAGGGDATGHAVAHRDRSAVGLGEPGVAAQDDSSPTASEIVRRASGAP